MSFAVGGCRKLFTFFLGNIKFSVCWKMVFHICYSHLWNSLSEADRFILLVPQILSLLRNNYSMFSVFALKVATIPSKSIKRTSNAGRKGYEFYGVVNYEQRMAEKFWVIFFNVWLLVPATLSSFLISFFIRWKVDNIFICFYRYGKLFLHHLGVSSSSSNKRKNCWRRKMICK